MLATLTVDIGDPACGDVGDNLYCQIQEAIDASEEGDSIEVHDGTYEPIVIGTNDLTIRAAADSAPIVDGDLNIGDENVVALNANGVTIEGLTAVNASGSLPNGSGFEVTGDNNILTENTADGNGFEGFFLSESDRNTLTSNTAIGNAGNGFSLSRSGGNILDGNIAERNRAGFLLAGVQGGNNTLMGSMAKGNATSGFTVASDGNTLESNIAEGNGGEGFVIADGNRNTFTGNTAKGNDRGGFFVGLGFFFIYGNTLTGNTAEDNSSDGFVLREADSNTLTSNTANDNGLSGFSLLDGNANILTGNTAEGNGSDGFYLGPLFVSSDSNTLTGNTASDNGLSGFSLLDSDNNTLTGNTANRNEAYGYAVDLIVANIFEDNGCRANILGGDNQEGLICDQLRIPGDANGDLAVNLLDFQILSDNFGITGSGTLETGDFNGDTNVDILDFDILQENYGFELPVPTVATESFIVADMERDGDVDSDDIDDFVHGLTDPATYEFAHGVPPSTNGDTDGDGDIDFDDIDGFVAILNGGSLAGKLQADDGVAASSLLPMTDAGDIRRSDAPANTDTMSTEVLLNGWWSIDEQRLTANDDMRHVSLARSLNSDDNPSTTSDAKMDLLVVGRKVTAKHVAPSSVVRWSSRPAREALSRQELTQVWSDRHEWLADTRLRWQR